MLILVFVLFASFTFLFSWIKSYIFRLVPRTLHESGLKNLFLRFFFPASSANPYKMSKKFEGSTKRKRPQKGSSSNNTTHASIRIVDDFATDDFRRDFNILDNIDIQLLRNTIPLPTDTHKKHSMCFTIEQFHARLCLFLSSLVRECLHYTQISPSFVHSNSILILMGCSILNQLFNLELFLLDFFFFFHLHY